MPTTIQDLRDNETRLAEAKSIAQKFASEVRDHFGDRLREIRLYGSAARGDWTPESDIDVLVLLDHLTTADEEWIIGRAVALGLFDSGYLLQPLFMTESDFSQLRRRERLFAGEVDREGIAL